MGKDLDLIQAVKANDVGLVRKILGKLSSSKSKKVTKKLNINIQDEDGFTALHHSALQGNTDITMALLDMECNVNARDKKGMSPLHLACWGGKTEITKLLVDARACVNTCADSGDTPLHLGCQHNNAGVVEILLDSNVDCTVVNKRGESALDLACRFGYVQVVEMLLKSKDCQKLLSLYEENPKTADPPLHIACKTGREEIVVMLLDAGADTNQRGTNGTALHEASLYGKTEVVKILLDNEADVSIANEEGYTPLDVVMQFTSSRASQDIKELLKEASQSKAVIAKAVHDYRNMYDPTCLSFKIGDIVEILEQNESGRWKGRTMVGNREIIGYFPSSMVKLSTPRKPSGKALSMKDAGVLPVGKYEMVTLPSASGQSSPVHGKRPRMSSFGKPNNGRSSPSPPETPQHTPSSPPNPITNGIQESKLFQKNRQDSLKYVEVSVENPSSPTSPTSSNGCTSTNYAEVVLMTGLNSAKNDQPPPSLPQKNYRSDSENGENGEGDDIWIKNSPLQPQLPPKERPLTPQQETPAHLKTEDVEAPEVEEKPGPNANPKVNKNERKLKSWELDVEIELEKEKEQHERKALSGSFASIQTSSSKSDSPKSVNNQTDTLKPNYEDMTLNSPDKEEPLFKRQVNKELYTPRKLDHSEPEARPNLTKRQLLSYENVELKPRQKDDIKSMLITDVDRDPGGDEDVQVQRSVSPEPPNSTAKHSYENVSTDFERETSKERHEFPAYEDMQTEEDESTQKYVTMKRVVSAASDVDINDGRALTKSESYENIDIKTSTSKGPDPAAGPAEYMSMEAGPGELGPTHDYINIKIPALPEGASQANPEQPKGLTMNEYNALYDWLESCRLAIYIDNFVKGGFDMISIVGLTPEDLTAINIIKTGHRKKLLSDAAKQKLSDDVFPRERPDDIMTWLRLIHLDQYIPQLMDNGFDDMEFVQDITIEDLESIGITKPGHQRKLWLAVGALGPNKTITNDHEKEREPSQPYLETDLDMVEKEKEKPVHGKKGKEYMSTDIDSALSRLPADGASDAGFADEEVTTIVRNAKYHDNSQASLAHAVASLHIESLNETRGSTPDLDDILDSLDDDPNSSTEAQHEESPSYRETVTENISNSLQTPPVSRPISDVNSQEISVVSFGVDTGTNERKSAEVPDELVPSETENDNKSTGSDPNVSAEMRTRFNSVDNNPMNSASVDQSKEDRSRGLLFDSKASKKAPPRPPVKPKSFKKPPPKIAPKPNLGQIKAKASERDGWNAMDNNTSEHSGGELERTGRRYTTGSTSRSRAAPPAVPPKVRHGSLNSISSEDSMEAAIEDVEKQNQRYEDRRRSFEQLRRRFTDPESMGSLSSDGSNDSKERIDINTRSEPGLQDQIKEVFRRSRENLVETEEESETSNHPEEVEPIPQPVSNALDITDEDLERDQQYTEDLMKDINSMLSDFSTEIDSMFDKTDDQSTTV